MSTVLPYSSTASTDTIRASNICSSSSRRPCRALDRNARMTDSCGAFVTRNFCNCSLTKMRADNASPDFHRKRCMFLLPLFLQSSQLQSPPLPRPRQHLELSTNWTRYNRVLSANWNRQQRALRRQTELGLGDLLESACRGCVAPK